jgi:hypothetical protein
MTSRPIYFEIPWRPICVAFALVLVMVTPLLVAGCVERTDTIPVSQPVTTQIIAMSDKDRAVLAVSDAEGMIRKTDGIIGWFRGNATRDDPGLLVIIGKREIAFNYLTTAKVEIQNGNYERAREKAEEAFQKANESYYDALQRQESINLRYYPPSCELKLPFDKTVCILLIGLVPVLLTVLIHSLVQTNPAIRDGLLRRFMGMATSFILFIGVSLLFTALVTGVKIGYVTALWQWVYLALVPWVCLMLVLIILSVIAIGYEIFPLGRFIISTKPQTADTERGTRRLLAGENWRVVRNSVTIMLILTMPLVIYIGILIAYPVRCM